VEEYRKTDGTRVQAHTRQAHCRKIESHSYFRNSTAQKVKNLKTSIKPWKDSEKEIVSNALSELPGWLKRYAFKEILRADVGFHPSNPAATVPQTKTLVIFDNFFHLKNKKDVLTHELSHVAFYDFSPNELMSFALASGWVLTQNARFPPKKLLESDSSQSISEDFASHIEHFYRDEEALMLSHPMSDLIIRRLIESKETTL